MSASAVMSQLLPDPGADEVGGGLALFDRVLEIMRAGDEFERLVARPQEIEDLARVARENAGVGRPLHDERGRIMFGEVRLPLTRRGFRSEERRVGKEGVRPCRSRWSPYP